MMEAFNIEKEIKFKLGPCGLLCERCFAFADGEIKKNCVELQKGLGNFEVYAERFTELLNEPKFSRYKDFKIILDYFAGVKCRGCRLDGCNIFPTCKVIGCSIEKGVDYCFECDLFPCNNTGFDEILYKRWMSGQKRMKEMGIEGYYNWIRDKPRY